MKKRLNADRPNTNRYFYILLGRSLSVCLLACLSLVGCTGPVKNPGFVVVSTASPETDLPSYTPTHPNLQDDSQAVKPSGDAPTRVPRPPLSPPSGVERTPTPGGVEAFTPSRTPTLLQKQEVEAEIQIFGPGEGSMVVSPIAFSTLLSQDISGPYRVELYASGELRYRKVWIGPEDPSQPVLLVEAIDFEVAQDSEPGHLVVSKLDDKGRLQAVNSVELTLLSQGKANLMPVPALYQKIIIEQPARFAEISDAFVTVTGLAHTSLSQPLKAQLVTEDGGVVGQRLSVSAVSNGNDYVAFSIQIPYQVNQRTPVRLIIFVDDLSVSIVTYLASQELWLNPLR